MLLWQSNGCKEFSETSVRSQAIESRIRVDAAELHVVRLTRPLEPIERLIADEERRALEQAMANLSERQRGAIALFHMEGLSGEESAKAMNLSAKAFESLLARARATLREHVQKIQNTRRCA